ncbi:potassium channel family protein [Rhodococcus sp. NPDC059234]|uniref:potassium channel family protein n=1 Tax=Rhodococcus sp. NPDC059234 TaxID=3346781 RepID=UPI00366A6A3D
MAGKLRARLRNQDTLTNRPDFALVGVLRIPEALHSPGRAIFRRVMMAVAVLMLAVVVVYIDRDGYRDAQENELSFLDCLYYATVSLSTTGYGDITPITPGARLINVIVITPLRVLFLIILISTTMAALTERSRQAFKIQRWRHTVRNHTVVVGYGTKGRTAVDAMLGDGIKPSEIVVVDTDQTVLDSAASLGLVTVQGSATKSDVLRLAGVQNAASVIVATNRDDTAVLVTLTAREVGPGAKIVAAIRETDNAHLLRQSGADSVVVSSETAGRLLGIARTTPTVVEMVEDLLTPEAGFAIAEREVERDEIGGSPRHLSDIVLGVVRDGRLVRVGSPEVDAVEETDRLLYIRRVGH